LISSAFNSTQARLQSLADQVDTEISRISDMIVGRSEIDVSYIDKLQDGDIRCVLSTYEEFSPDVESAVSNFIQNIYSELLQDSLIHKNLKKEVENLTFLVEEDRLRISCSKKS
jgi:phage-related protein